MSGRLSEWIVNHVGYMKMTNTTPPYVALYLQEEIAGKEHTVLPASSGLGNDM